MDNKPMDELFKRIISFNDTGIIILYMHEIANNREGDGENSSDAYWVKEAICNLEGMFELLMDLKKSHETFSGINN